MSLNSVMPYGVTRAPEKNFSFSAKFEAQYAFFIHSFISKFRLQHGALGMRDFQTPLVSPWASLVHEAKL